MKTTELSIIQSALDSEDANHIDILKFIQSRAETLTRDEQQDFVHRLLIDLMDYLGFAMAHGDAPRTAQSLFILAIEVDNYIDELCARAKAERSDTPRSKTPDA